VDSSAIIAVITQESDASWMSSVLAEAPTVRMSAANYLETAVVIDSRRGPVNSRNLDALIALADIEIVPVTVAQAQIARQAYRDFGRGSRHAANLNFGDCFAYALAKDTGEPLLYKGDDFIHTDVAPAMPQT